LGCQKSSNCPASNGNLHEPPMRNLLNPYLEEDDCYV
jgi:hypothetical protein